ncbi:MAG: hypothetical protein AABM66_09900 [Actinomycetota bacterium]
MSALIQTNGSGQNRAPASSTEPEALGRPVTEGAASPRDHWQHQV